MDPASSAAPASTRRGATPDRHRPSIFAGPLGTIAGVTVVLVAILALREIAALVVPVLFGLFVALIAWPLVGLLRRRGASHGVALAGTICAVLLVVLAAAAVLAVSVAELAAKLPRYENQLRTVIAHVRDVLAGFGIAANPEDIPGIISPAALANLVRSVASALSHGVAAMLILALTTIFALTGAASLQLRAARAFGERHALLGGVELFGRDLRRYLLVRAQLGLFAAVAALLLLLVLSVPQPLLWSLLVFAASFIPTVGMIVAVVPPTALALLDGGAVAAGAVVAGFTVINLAQDYLLQPKIMSAQLNLNPLVVFISIVAWGWILGAAGALLAVPLTVGLVAFLEAFPESRGIAALMRDRIDTAEVPDLVASAAAVGAAAEKARD